MLTRSQRRKLKATLITACLALVFLYFVRMNLKRLDKAERDQFNGTDMQSMAKREALKRKASMPAVNIDISDFEIPDEIKEVEKILERSSKNQKAKQAKSDELEGSSLALQKTLDKIASLLTNSGDKIDELQALLEKMTARIQAQEDTTIELESLMKSRLMFVAEKQEQILKQTTAITKQNEIPFYNVRKFAEPLVSTVTCFGSTTYDRVCKIKNLCYDPPTDKFFIFKDTNSLEVNTPRNRSYLVDGTSIDGHNRFYFDYQEVHPDQYEQRTVRLVDRLSFLISRFHVFNIMHTVHDDFIGLYLLHRMFAPNSDEDPAFSFTQDNNIFFVDSWTNLRYDYIFQLLTKNRLQFREAYRVDGENKMPICFRDAIVGNSKHGSWYTYGFLEPQGPIANKTVSGLMLRDVASYLMKRFHLPVWNENAIRGIVGDLKGLVEDNRRKGRRDILSKSISDHHFITVFSRKIDRIITNEDDLVRVLSRVYGLEVRYVRIEDMHLMEQISILKNTVIAMGMHGSALILSMFLPPGALLLEFFPYRVPAENYTPYKTLCGLPGIRLTYRAWVNKHAENNFPHPEKPPQGGGIKHLPEEEQQKILNNPTVPPHLCCSDPTWLFRIYQDTKVDIDEVMDLIDDGIMDCVKEANSDPSDYVYVRPASIENVYCKTSPREDREDQMDLHVSWTKPWNAVNPDFYGVWLHQTYSEYTSENRKTSLVITNCTVGKEYDMWVRPYVKDRIDGQIYKGSYSDKFTCVCDANTQAIKKKKEEL